MTVLAVVTGVLIRDGRVLLTQRPPDKDYPYEWETPGGKVEPDESLYGALCRELREELGILAGDGRLLWEKEVPRSGRDPVRLTFFRVFSWTGHPTPLEGQGLGWFQPDDLRLLELAPGNSLCRDRLKWEIVHEAGVTP